MMPVIGVIPTGVLVKSEILTKPGISIIRLVHPFWPNIYANFRQVFRKIAKQLPSLISLDLQYVSPKLQHARDLELAVPGRINVFPSNG